MIIGFVISLFVFFWALNNGQFKDQQRARYLPLEDEEQSQSTGSSKTKRFEIYALFLLASAGLLASAATLIFALFSAS